MAIFRNAWRPGAVYTDMPAISLRPRRVPVVLSVIFSLACWFLLLCWLLGLYIRSGFSRGDGGSLDL